MSSSPAGAEEALLARDVTVRYPTREGGHKREVHALRGASLTLPRGGTVALVGESGSGKSTLGRVLLGLRPPEQGEVRCDDVPVYHGRRTNPGVGRRVQVVFQSPSSSLDPRKSVGRQITRCVELARGRRGGHAGRRAHELLEEVGLDPAGTFFSRYPDQLSGGQQQRVAVARALTFQPRYLIADEPTSALDVSVQVQILELLRRVQQEHGMGILFITHDLATVRSFAEHLHVMYLGEVVEAGPTRALFDHPEHPYTRALMGASPTLAITKGTAAYRLAGEPPSATDVPTGCSLHPRCPVAMDTCTHVHPIDHRVDAGWHARCHLAGDLPPSPPMSTTPIRQEVETPG